MEVESKDIKVSVASSSKRKGADDSSEKPKIFSYLDYRDFLRDYFNFLKEKHHYTGSRFSSEVGFKSASYLKMILDKKRSLSGPSARSLVERLKFSTAEIQYFVAVVRFNDEKSPDRKEQFRQEVLKYKELADTREMKQDQFELFKSWYAVVILEALGTSWGTLSIAEMATSLGISEGDTLATLYLLIRLGLAEKRDDGYFRKNLSLDTPFTVRSSHIRNWHRQMITKALESVDGVKLEERSIGGLTIALSKDQFLELAELLQQFRQKVNATYSESKQSTRIYQFNFQLFPLLDLQDSSGSSFRKK